MKNNFGAILGDQSVTFDGGNVGFEPGINSNRTFVLTLVNANAATRYAYISPGLQYDPTGTIPAGVITDAAFNDRDGNAGLTGSSGGYGTIKNFLSYIQKYPTICKGFKISSTMATQLDLNITFEPQNPFQQQETLNLSLAQYKSERNENDKLLTVPFEFYFDGHTRILLPVAGSSTCNITFYFGATLSNDVKLRRMNAAAKKATLDAGGAGVVQKSIQGMKYTNQLMLG